MSSGDPSSSASSVLGLQVHATVPGFSTGALGLELGSLCLYSSTLLIELSPKSSLQLQTLGPSNTCISLDLCSSHPDLESQGTPPLLAATHHCTLYHLTLHLLALVSLLWPPRLLSCSFVQTTASALRWVPHCHLFLTFSGALHAIAQGMAQSLLRIMNQLPMPSLSLSICPFVHLFPQCAPSA